MLAENALSTLFQVPQLALFMSLLIPIVGIVAFYWYRAQKVNSENRLKRSMVERGMSAEEIERVLAAGSDECRDHRSL